MYLCIYNLLCCSFSIHFCILTLAVPETKTAEFANSVDLDEMAYNNLIWIYTVCPLVFEFAKYDIAFLLCYSMNYRDFSVKSKLIISLFQTVKLSL